MVILVAPLQQGDTGMKDPCPSDFISHVATIASHLALPASSSIKPMKISTRNKSNINDFSNIICHYTVVSVVPTGINKEVD